ncbi:S8 family serine peptidase, partial [Cloacibacillus porcorum]
MKLNLWKITAAVLAALLLAVPVRLSADVVKGEYAEGRILVKIVSAPQGVLKGRSLSSASSTEIAGMKIEKSWDFAASKTSAENGGRTLSAGGTEGGERIALLSSGTMSTAQMLAAAEKEPSITYAEPDYKIYPASLPNDPAVTEQWAYSNKIKSPAGGAATVNIQSAWGRAEASHNAEVAVAVVDMGVDYEHPDLKDNMWDGSEYGYPKHGWDSALDTNDPMDRDGHGTHVAGIVAASSNNGIGIAGAARGTKIIAVKVFGRSDGFSSSVVDAYSKLLALKASGVKLVATNNSWTAPILSKTAAEAMEALGRAGVVNVVAAANDHADNDTTMGFPFNFPSDYSVVVAA